MKTDPQTHTDDVCRVSFASGFASLRTQRLKPMRRLCNETQVISVTNVDVCDDFGVNNIYLNLAACTCQLLDDYLWVRFK